MCFVLNGSHGYFPLSTTPIYFHLFLSVLYRGANSKVYLKFTKWDAKDKSCSPRRNIIKFLHEEIKEDIDFFSPFQVSCKSSTFTFLPQIRFSMELLLKIFLHFKHTAFL